MKIADFEGNTALKRLVLKGLNGLLVEEELNDPLIVDERRDVCCNCDYMEANVDNPLCMKCGCFLGLKTKSKVNRTLTGIEITHCPLNKWLDEFSKAGYELANKN